MMRHIVMFVLAVTLLLTLAASFAAEPDPASVVTVEPQPVPTSVIDESGSTRVHDQLGSRPLSPRMEAMQRLFLDEKLELERLQDLFKQAATPERALAIQREMGAIKERTEVGMLQVQLDFARREGRLEAAANLERVIEEMTAPRPVADPESPASRH